MRLGGGAALAIVGLLLVALISLIFLVPRGTPRVLVGVAAGVLALGIVLVGKRGAKQPWLDAIAGAGFEREKGGGTLGPIRARGRFQGRTIALETPVAITSRRAGLRLTVEPSRAYPSVKLALREEGEAPRVGAFREDEAFASAFLTPAALVAAEALLDTTGDERQWSSVVLDAEGMRAEIATGFFGRYGPVMLAEISPEILRTLVHALIGLADEADRAVERSAISSTGALRDA